MAVLRPENNSYTEQLVVAVTPYEDLQYEFLLNDTVRKSGDAVNQTTIAYNTTSLNSGRYNWQFRVVGEQSEEVLQTDRRYFDKP